jgi:hypothetical protein
VDFTLQVHAEVKYRKDVAGGVQMAAPIQMDGAPPMAVAVAVAAQPPQKDNMARPVTDMER